MKLKELVAYKYSLLFFVFLFAGVFLEQMALTFVAGVLLVMMVKEIRELRK
jgi:hypothetical protein